MTKLPLLLVLLVFGSPLLGQQQAGVNKGFAVTQAIYLINHRPMRVTPTSVDLNEVRMSFEEKSILLSDVFDRLNKIKGVCILVDEEVRAYPERIRLVCKKATVSEILELLMKLAPIVCIRTQKVVNVKFNPNLLRNVPCLVVDSSGHPVSKAEITIERTGETYKTDRSGRADIRYLLIGDSLLVGSADYTSLPMVVNELPLKIVLLEKAKMLDEVVHRYTYNDGYRKYTDEERTGSAKVVDMDLYTGGSPNTNIISQMENIMPIGHHENALNGTVPGPARGSNTFYGNKDAFIVVGDFAWNLPTDLINPNDIDSICLLRDAGSSAIWGTTGANGVWSLSYKKGQPDKRIINFLSTLSVGERPSNLYQQGMNADVHITFDSLSYKEPGAYTPVRDLLNQVDNNSIAAKDAQMTLDSWRKKDLLKDIRKQLYTNPITQQYAINIQTGYRNFLFYASAGLDQKKLAENGGKWSRKAILINSSYREKSFLIEGTLAYTNIANDNRAIAIPISPRYLSLKEPDGKESSLPYLYPPDFTAKARQNGFLDWSYRPLEEARLVNNTTHQNYYSFTGKVSYRLLPQLKASVAYQNSLYLKEDKQLYPLASFYTRNLVNLYRQKDSSGKLSWPIPQGDILDAGDLNSKVNNLRAQLDYTASKNKFKIAAFTGIDRRSFEMNGKDYRIYGKNLSANSFRMDYSQQYLLSTGGKLRIPFEDHLYDSADHFFSAYSSATITFDNRIIVTGSYRKDWSNHFSKSLNKTGVGLWSMGAGWNIHKEPFFQSDWIRLLKLRGTYGISGNIDMSALPTHSIQTDNNGQVYSYVVPSTDQIGWERITILNLGVDLDCKWAIMTLDYYFKWGKDLLQYSLRNSVTGTNVVKDNSGTLNGRGIDIDIKTKPIKFLKDFTYTAGLVIARSINRTTSFGGVPKMASEIINTHTYGPVEGYPTNALFAYKSGGLDPQTGAPVGYIDGNRTMNYAAIMATTNGSSLQYMGSSVPTTGINWLNSFHFRSWTLSSMLNAKLGYWVWKPALNYYKILMGLGGEGPGFENRWQKPGQDTKIPALDYDYNAMTFNESNSENVVKGDNIRLQWVKIAYRWENKKSKEYLLNSIECSLTAGNLGIILRANKDRIDPEVPLGGIPNGRSLTLTFKLSF